jgi:hypothetical protein
LTQELSEYHVMWFKKIYNLHLEYYYHKYIFDKANIVKTLIESIKKRMESEKIKFRDHVKNSKDEFL